MALILLTANNAQTVLAAGISASATSLTVNSGTGALFPSASAGVSYFKLTLVDAATGQLSEIVHVTARSGDTMTITRGQEGTTARAWSANDIAANMLTAGTISLLAPLDSPALTGTPTVPTASPGTSTTQTASTAFVASAITAATGRLITPPQRFTSSGTYTPTAGAKFIIVEQQAPGGNGANAPATASGYVASGPGGGSGAYAKFLVLISNISNFTVSVGTVAAASNSATQAGSSSFCGVTCTGGSGPSLVSSQVNTTVVQGKGAAGGTVSNAGTTTLTMLISSKGNEGGNSLATVAGNALSGTGAQSFLYGSSAAIGGSGAGNAGVDGSGGSGANSQAYTTSGLTGGTGGNGVTLIWEYA
ncbi:TPA: hypothetical protein JAX15_004734 [Enterobacter roggenkampii]|nr:hypothetical protein [Enterobacter roggenkampii]HAT7723081.1 hypothetical protein [Enterobacter roggenkampii]